MSPDRERDALRLIFPQWQACGADYAAEFTANLSRESVRHGYELGSRLLSAVFPATDDDTVIVPVVEYDTGVDRGIESRPAVLENLRTATRLIADRDPDRIVTFGGDCSVSVPSLTYLAAKYGDDLAIVWLDSHPDCSLPGGNYQGYHDMALAHITGHGDDEFLAELPATVSPDRVVLAGTHSWNDDEYENFQNWGIAHLPPDTLRQSPQKVMEWLHSTGCRKVVLHLDVDSVDANQFHLGMGAEPDGLTKDQVQAIISAVSTHQNFDLVGFTLGEFIPRQVLAIQELVQDVPLL
ncbi:arginase family protein [Rhodococcus sp. NPDC057529]|uniref:arginase family protein n=1 Tax=Rhodococcus sp. NPDC057529 TaxID=3346158 RepID=UPI00366E23EF